MTKGGQTYRSPSFIGMCARVARASMRNDLLGGGAQILRLARGSVAAFAIYIAGAGLTYCSQLLIARIVGANSYGIYAYVLAWMTVLAYASALGFDISLLRFVAAYRAQEDWGLLRGVIQYAERRVAIVGFSLALIGICVMMIWAREQSPELASTFRIGFFLVPVWALLWIQSSSVRAFGGVVSAVAPDRMVRDGLLIVLIALATLLPGLKIDAALVMMATLASSAAGLGLVSVGKRRLRPRAIDHALPAYARPIWRRTVVPLLIIGAAEALLNRTGVVLLGWMGDTRDAGIYALAFNIAFLVVLPRTAVNALFAPTVSDLFVRNDRAALQGLVTKAASWTLLGAAGIALPIALLAGPLLDLFGQDFGGGVPALRILLIGQVFAAGAGSQLQLMTMTGHERSAALLLISSAVVNAVFSVALIDLFGLAGAALATTTTLIVWNVAMARFIWRNLRLSPSVIAIFRLRPRAKIGMVGHRGSAGE